MVNRDIDIDIDDAQESVVTEAVSAASTDPAGLNGSGHVPVQPKDMINPPPPGKVDSPQQPDDVAEPDDMINPPPPDGGQAPPPDGQGRIPAKPRDMIHP
jgi:hypothetical protein